MLYILNCTMLCINYISVKLRCGRNRNIDKSNHAINLIKTLCCCCCWVLSIVSDSVRPQRRQPTRLSHPWDSPGKNTGVGCHFLFQCMKVKVKSLSRVRLLATSWTAAYQAPLSMGFSRQEYWSGLPLQNPLSRSIPTVPKIKFKIIKGACHPASVPNTLPLA